MKHKIKKIIDRLFLKLGYAPNYPINQKFEVSEYKVEKLQYRYHVLNIHPCWDSLNEEERNSILDEKAINELMIEARKHIRVKKNILDDRSVEITIYIPVKQD